MSQGTSLINHWTEPEEQEIREEHNIVQAKLELLRNLIKGEAGLYSRMDDIFLLSFLRARKFNVHQAFTVLKNFYKIRKNYPVYFEDCLPSEKGYIYDSNGITVLDQKDNDGRIVLILRVDVDMRILRVENLLQQLSTTLSFCLEDPLVQIAGVTVIIDLKGFSFQHFYAVTPSCAYLLVKMFQDSFPVKTKNVHIVNEPIYFTALFSLFKKFLKEKLRKRIHIHGKNMASLHSHVPYEILPRQLGGMVPDFNFSKFRRIIAENEDTIRGWRKYGYHPQNAAKNETVHSHNT